MKIINILHHSLSTHNKEADPLFYEDGWHVRVAQRVKNYTNDYNLECWRPERNIENEFERTNNGITYRIFPSKYFIKFEYSHSLINKLKSSADENTIVHLHGIIYPLSYMILKAVNKNIPTIGQSHEASSTLTNAIFERSIPNKFERLKKPIISLERLYQKRLLSKIDYFFCLSENEKIDFSAYGKAVLQPMGVDFGKFKPIQRDEALKMTGLEDNEYLLYVGRLEKRKGLKYLLNGFKKFSENNDKKLIIVGEGPFKQKLISLSRNLGIFNKVHFLDYIQNTELPYYYNVADITIFPSISEAYPVVPIESLACQTPVITTNVGSISQISSHFRGGLKIIPIKSAKAINDALNEFISGKMRGLDIDRENGKRYYDWDIIIKNTVNIYNELSEL